MSTKEYFDPKTDKFPYPEYTDQHYLKVKKDNGIIIDENYPYIDDSKAFRFKRFLVNVLLTLIVFPACRVRLGLKISGRKELMKNHKEEIKRGIISCSNHVHMWDYLSIMKSIRPIRPYILSWSKNITGENSALVRLVGGIPIPENNYRATKAYLEAVSNLLENGKWLHIMGEGSMWEYYAPIRPFKKGLAYFAIENNRPIVPMGFSYRQPNWFRRKILRTIACFNLKVGEPIYANKNLPREEMENDLIIRVHDAICELAGINPKDNIYPAIFDHTKRIDYYTSEYGRGYKGSK